MTATATFVNALSVPLMGTSFGVDFNPAADRLRIVSDLGQNLASRRAAASSMASPSVSGVRIARRERINRFLSDQPPDGQSDARRRLR